MTRELLIKGGYVVTGDPKPGDLPRGGVLIRDDIVAASRHLTTAWKGLVFVRPSKPGTAAAGPLPGGGRGTNEDDL